jgi:two-component system nitrogen regulation sensor histidine kinase NtrY
MASTTQPDKAKPDRTSTTDEDPSGPPPTGLSRTLAWARRRGLSRYAAIALTVAAIASGIVTYISLTGSPPYGPNPDVVFILLNVDLVLLLMLGTLIGRRIARLWAERRAGLAGSRMHVRLVLLFGIVAVTPAILVAVFSAFFFNFGIQAWFGERVRTALQESLKVTDAYLREHQQTIRADTLAMANALNRDAPVLMRSSILFRRVVTQQAAARSLPEALVFDGSGAVLATTGLSFALQLEPVPEWAMERAKKGEVAVMARFGDERVRAIVKLDRYNDTYLYVGRFIDPTVLGYVQRTQEAVDVYRKLESQRSVLQISFFLLFAVVAMLLLMAAVWIGLMFANQLMKPIGALITASHQIRAGDLSTRVPESKEDVDIGGLGRAFNRMAKRLERNRKELVEANRQLDARRKFTETVLAGVSAGVIGLDAQGRINLPNRSASELLGTDLDTCIGQLLGQVVPEMAALIKEVSASFQTLKQSELTIVREGTARTLLVRVAVERLGGNVVGYVVTFDDITELQSAQRKAAWADVARRIAHEIKNPLTPIQLSAERLKRKYLEEIKTEPDIFATCTDTIVRQVSDIGRMVDEFSSFARMPAPVMSEENLAEICRQAVFLQSHAQPAIEFQTTIPDAPVILRCDNRQVSQALTNLLKNAVDSILDRKAASGQKSPKGRITLQLRQSTRQTEIVVEDNGVGLPEELLHRLTEPYVTTRKKGTGLGLAIVAKIMEDHGGRLVLENKPKSAGARAKLIFMQGGGARSGSKSEPEPADIEQSRAAHGA